MWKFSLWSLVLHLTIEDTFFFEGDSFGEFKGDYVAILSDGSGWKVHPDDRYKFSLWSHHDEIQIRERSSFYWFERKHHFELYNRFNDQTVRVMFVKYPPYPIQILATDICLAKTFWEGEDFDIYPVYYYDKILYLSNGSVWVVHDRNNDEFPYYCLNANVYIVYDGWKILITGIERKAHRVYQR